MTTFWVIRNGSIECQVACAPAPVAAPASHAATNPGLSSATCNRTGSLGISSVARGGFAGVRLNRRGRVAVALSSLLLTAPLLGAGVLGSGAKSVEPPDTVPYTVAAGESLWSIAERNKVPGSDTRDEIDQIKRLNRLDSSNLYAGQVILVVSK